MLKSVQATSSRDPLADRSREASLVDKGGTDLTVLAPLVRYAFLLSLQEIVVLAI